MWMWSALNGDFGGRVSVMVRGDWMDLLMNCVFHAWSLSQAVKKVKSPAYTILRKNVQRERFSTHPHSQT